MRFLQYVHPYKWWIVLAVMGGVVKFTVPLLVPLMTCHLIDDVLSVGNDVLNPEQKMRELYLYIGGMMAIFLFFFAPWVYVRHLYAGKAGHRSVFDLRCELYYRILRMSASFFSRNRSGSIVSRLISDIELAQNLVGNALTNVWMDGASIFVVLIFMWSKSPKLTLVSLVTFPIYLYFFRKLRVQLRTASYAVQQEISNLAGNVSEKISGSVVVHSFTQEKQEDRKFLQDSERLFSLNMQRIGLQSLNMAFTATLTSLAPLIVLFFGGMQIVQGQLTIGEMVAFTLWLAFLYTPLQRFSELNIIFANSMAALDRIFEIMDEAPEIVDRPDAVALDVPAGKVEFHHVCFSYQPGLPTLKDIHFTVLPGQKVALVGPSGSGKSTLVSLIPRFYDVDSGAIRIDGQDIRDIQIKSLRKHVGMVLQEPILFSGPIRDNVLYGKPQASEAELIEACQAANAYDFIRALPNGFDTETGERGIYLSGGEKQRVTIARAFLKNPKILILDEATSSLDSESERLVQEALDRLLVGRTTFIIAHRLSTIVNADLIFVMEHGSIVESGRHEELVLGDGLYRRLYEEQFQSVFDSRDQYASER